MAQTMAGSREASITSWNNIKVPRPASSGTSLQRQYHAGAAQPSRRRAKSASNLLNGPGQTAGFCDDTLLHKNSVEQDGLAELIDFLRNQAPPSDNFMSIPEDGDERGRAWSVLKKLRKRAKSLPKTPLQIRLPDSAVSGTTIGGHRHIAISIPLEASPFGTTPRSQYPIIENTYTRPLTSSFAPTRAIVNEKGVVTVLRTVTEVRETPSTSSPSGSQLQPSSTGQQPHTTPSGTLDFPGSRRRGANVRAFDYFGVAPTSATHNGVERHDGTRHGLHRDGDPRPRAPTLYHRSSYPVRGSSLTASRTAIPPTSIDGMMSQQTNVEAVPRHQTLPRTLSNRQEYQQSASGNVAVSHQDSDISDPRQIKAARSTPAFIGESEHEVVLPRTNQIDTSIITVITENPLTFRQPSSPTTPSLRSVQSRREKVRERKRRDMEALRDVSQTPQSQESRQESPLAPTNNPLGKDTENRPAPHRISKPRRTICPIMVVTDVIPSPPPDRDMVQSQLTSTSSSKPATSAPVARLNGSSNPTPPHSTQASPTHRQTFLDRTSLSRRREWNAVREKERKNREAKAALRAKTRQLSLAMEQMDKSRGPTVEDEVLARYEAYREYRIREMERRMRRLERNGDVWLRALVPVLDNLNKTLANVHEEQSTRARGWVSDDEYLNREERRGRSMGCKRYTARGRSRRSSTASERRLLNKLARGEEDPDSDSLSDEMSGLDTIEPLMRELAGRSRLSFETRRTMSEERRR